MSDLHAQIMNLPCEFDSLWAINMRIAYKTGHKDARHAAAELALAHDARIRQLEEALTTLTNACAECKGYVLASAPMNPAVEYSEALRIACAALKEQS